MYSAIIEEDDNGDLILPLPDKLIEELGWDFETELTWTINEDGTCTLRKSSN